MGDEQPDALSSAQAEALLVPIAAPQDPSRRKRHSAFLEGFSLHAGVHLHANDREGLERLLRYGARPPLSLARLAQLPDGRLGYRLKRPVADDRQVLVLQPTELLRRLATLVPSPRHHLCRYHGVFAPNSAWRSEVVPLPPEQSAAVASELPHESVTRPPEGNPRPPLRSRCRPARGAARSRLRPRPGLSLLRTPGRAA